jgi:hypothetical protein
MGEGGAVVGVKKMDRRFYKLIPNSRPMGSWVVMFIHSVSESFRLATLWYSAILAPESTTWIDALVSSLVLNTAARIGWPKYFVWRLTCKNAFWIPSCWSIVHREAKFAFGYGRFGAPIAAAGARYILSYVGKSESLCCTSEISPYFNDTVLHVWIGSFIIELMEDAAVMFFEWRRLDPSWYTDKTVRTFCGRINDRDAYDASAPVWCSPIPNVKPVNKVHYQERSFKSHFVHLAITNAATFMVYTGLTTLVSLDFLLGFSGEYVDVFEDAARNGAFLWSLPGE